MDEEEWKLIDLYTDKLFAPQAASERIQAVVFPYCRMFCDVERLVNDPLEAKGLGIHYRRSTSDGQVRTWGQRAEAYKQYVQFHSHVVEKIIDKCVTRAGSLLIIDCHSFSSLPNLLNDNPPTDIDICIGYNDDETMPNPVVTGDICNYFTARGYRVGINTPFSNSKTFDVPGNTPYHSLMIEVNKHCYMNETTRVKTTAFNNLHNALQDLYTLLLR